MLQSLGCIASRGRKPIFDWPGRTSASQTQANVRSWRLTGGNCLAGTGGPEETAVTRARTRYLVSHRGLAGRALEIWAPEPRGKVTTFPHASNVAQSERGSLSGLCRRSDDCCLSGQEPPAPVAKQEHVSEPPLQNRIAELIG